MGKTVRLATSLTLALFCLAAAEPGVPLFFGEAEGIVWIEVETAGSKLGFRLASPPEGRTGVQLLFPDLPQQQQRSVLAGLEHLKTFDVEPSGGGQGTIISLPFSLEDLASVDWIPRGGWRFTFVVSDAPAAAVATAESHGYLVGVRDQLEITVFGHADLSKTMEVNAGGTFDFPLIGVLQLAGRSVDDIQAEITRRLAEDYLVSPSVGVRISDYQSQWVNIMGQVKRPGKHYLKGQSTLIDLITESGGLSDRAGTHVTITRQEEQGVRQMRINLQDLFSAASEEFNLLLRRGDVVEVAEQDRFYIQGEVARPGSYPLERGFTLMKAITVAGGLSQWADRKRVEVLRETDGERQTLELNLKAIGARKERDVELMPDDIIIVKRRLL